MAITNAHLIIARDFLALLSWRRVFMIFLCSVIALTTGICWTYRKEFFYKNETKSNLSTNVVMSVSPEIRDEIDAVVRKSQLIVGIKIITINFQRNIRTDSFVSIDDPVVMDIYTKGLNNQIFETPLFSENKNVNKRLLRLISGEFVCVPFKETTAYVTTPLIYGPVTDVCSGAIPPYHGDFSGILTIYLSAHPTKDDTERLFLLSRDISIKIYEENKHGKNDKK